MPTITLLQNNFKALSKIIDIDDFIDNNEEGYLKIKSSSFMDLVIENHGCAREGVYKFSITHYFEANGDLIADPDMMIEVDTKNKLINALSYQDTYGYNEVYSESETGSKLVNLRQFDTQNKFLKTWLTNLKDQGFKYKA